MVDWLGVIVAQLNVPAELTKICNRQYDKEITIAEAVQLHLSLLEQVGKEIIGEDLGAGDDETFAYYENRLRAAQRQTLATLLKGEKDE